MRAAFLSLILFCYVMVSSGTAQTPQAKPHRVVFQMNLDAPASWGHLVANIQNVQKAFGEDKVQIEVVAFGRGIALLLKKDTQFETALKRAADSGVIFAACQNSLRDRNLTA